MSKFARQGSLGNLKNHRDFKTQVVRKKQGNTHRTMLKSETGREKKRCNKVEAKVQFHEKKTWSFLWCLTLPNFSIPFPFSLKNTKNVYHSV